MSSPASRRRIAGLVAVPVVAAGLLVVPALGRGDTVDASPRTDPLPAAAAPTPAASPAPASGAEAAPSGARASAGTSGPAPAPAPGASATEPPPAPEPAPATDAAATGPGAPAPAAGPAAVDVRVTVHGWDAGRAVAEVVALVAAVQDDGTCVLTLRGPGGVVATAPSAAVPDVSTTVCGLLAVERERLVPGTWQATVTYASGRSTGTSAPVTIEVP